MLDDMDIQINAATVADISALQQVSTATFIDTYAGRNTPEDIRIYIETNYDTQRLLEELADPAMHYYLAYSLDEVVAYMKLRTTDNPPELAGKRHLEVERIYVLAHFKGRHIGKQMIDFAINTARDHLYEVVWLGVWDQNTEAQNFYAKQGFTIFGEHTFSLGTDSQRDLLLKKDVM